MRKDVDYLKSTDFISLFESAQHWDAPTSFEMTSATNGDVRRDDVTTDVLDVKKDEEQLDSQDATIYEDLPYLEETIVKSVTKTLLTETSMEGSSESSVDVTSDRDVQDQSVAQGIYAPDK